MRQVICWNDGWKFSLNAAKKPAEPSDSWIWGALSDDWEEVTLPHTWNGLDGQDGGGDYYRGMGIYVKDFAGSSLPPAEEYWFEITGANSSSDVILNGVRLMHHDGGYSTFRVNLTSAIRKEANRLIVAVDNSPNDRVYPQKADFTFYGGLYRNVNLIAVGTSHFDLGNFGGPGIQVTPTVVGAGCGSKEQKNAPVSGEAEVEIEVRLAHPRAGQKLQYLIRESDGAVAASRTVPAEKTRITLTMSSAHLWNGRKDPYLYTAEVRLLEEEILDTVSARFGFRTFHIDPEQGFFLNGSRYPLYGVSRHQDRPEIGNALLPQHHIEDIDLICEMGATTVRLAHYQHDEQFYDLCDERGLVVWAEIPYISHHMPNGRENTISQLKELIVQNINHPSIAVWSISNEITITGRSDDLLDNHRVLNELCHEMDPTRLTTLAVVSECDIHDPYVHITDVVSYNHYFGWYGGEASMTGPWLDRFHEIYPKRAIGVSEYGCEALNWHTSRPRQADYTEEYQALYHEEMIRTLFSRPYIWATHVWNMFDFGADNRDEGGESGKNHKGLVTFDRQYRKDAFYAYKAWLSDEPFVHICGRRYVDRAEETTKVTVYSNLPEVELFADGQSLGIRTAEDHFFRYEVLLETEAGRDNILLAAKAYGKVENLSSLWKKDSPAGCLTMEVLSTGSAARRTGRSADAAQQSEDVFPKAAAADEIVIRKVEVPNENYIMKDSHLVLNWFDVTEPEGRLSLNSMVEEVNACPEGRQLLKNMFLTGIPDAEKDRLLDLLIAEYGLFTVLRLAGTPGLFAWSDVAPEGESYETLLTKETLLDYNRRLNQIDSDTVHRSGLS